MELGGPAEYTRRELAEFTFDVTKQKAKLIDVPASMAAAAASFVDVLPVPLWVPDDVELDRLDVVCSGGEDVLTFADFGMAPTPIEKVAFSYLHRYREGGHFLVVGQVYRRLLSWRLCASVTRWWCCRGGGVWCRRAAACEMTHAPAGTRLPPTCGVVLRSAAAARGWFPWRKPPAF